MAELYNLRHSSACNIVKHVIGIARAQTRILETGPQFKDFNSQVKVVVACAVILNFIHHYGAGAQDCIAQDYNAAIQIPYERNVNGDVGRGQATSMAVGWRNATAQQMWVDYKALLAERGQQNPPIADT